jgi:polysaccharide pyruvyl transferase WcaK-like protein
MRAYHQLDAVIGSRGHMGIFAIGASTPFLFISYNVKCDALTDDIDYPKRYVMHPQEITSTAVLANFRVFADQTLAIKKFLHKHKIVQYRQELSAIRSLSLESLI